MTARGYERAKRAADVALAGAVGIVAAPVMLAIAAAIKARRRRAHPLPPGTSRPVRPTVRDRQVPDACRRAGPRPGGLPHLGGRPANHAGRCVPTPLVARRAAPALERASGRNEHRRPSAHAALPGRPVRRLPASASRGAARRNGMGPGVWAKRARLAFPHRTRRLVCRPQVAAARRRHSRLHLEDPLSDPRPSTTTPRATGASASPASRAAGRERRRRAHPPGHLR